MQHYKISRFNDRDNIKKNLNRIGRIWLETLRCRNEDFVVGRRTGCLCNIIPSVPDDKSKLKKLNILYTVNTQQHQYSDIMYAVGYAVAACFDRKRSSSGQ